MALVTTKTVLAVWPADAEIQLVPKETDAQSLDVPGWMNETSHGVKNSVLATSDIDGDHIIEILLLTQAPNNFGVSVYLRGTEKPVFSFDCGSG